MAAPALRIPVAVDLAALKEQMDSGAAHVGRAARFMGDQFQKLNSTIVAGGGAAASTYASGFAAASLRIVGAFALIYVAAKAAGAIIDATREKLRELVEVADKAKDRGLGPGFFQAFTAEAEKLQVKATDLEGALASAFQATKEKSPIDLDKWETGKEKITEVEKALRVFNETLTKPKGETLEGLVLFRDAENQEQKVKAVLEAMIQLERIGQRAAALDVGEKMFGAQFVDRIRQGRTSAAEMLETIKRIQSTSGQMFSDEMINRAKEIDDKLKAAHKTLEENLRPASVVVAGITLEIKDLWANIVELIAEAVGLFPNFAGKLPKDEVTQLKDEFKLLNKELALLEAEGKGMSAAADEIRGLIEGIANALKAAGHVVPILVTGGSKGTGPAPSLRATGGAGTRDQFQQDILNMEKRIALGQAEVDTIDLATEARARAKIQAELTAEAVKANTAAGMKDTKVTAEQQAEIDRLADKYAALQVALEKARLPLNEFARDARNSTKMIHEVGVKGLTAFEDALIDIAFNAKTTKQAFHDMVESILKDIARLLIRLQITGPLAQTLSQIINTGAGAVSGITGRSGIETYTPPGSPRSGPVYVPPMARSGVESAAVNIEIKNYGGAKVESGGSRQNGDGTRTLELLIDRHMARGMNTPGTATDRAMLTRGISFPLTTRG